MAFLDGAPPERLCQPMVDHMLARGGDIKMNARVKDIVLNVRGSSLSLYLALAEQQNIWNDLVFWCWSSGCGHTSLRCMLGCEYVQTALCLRHMPIIAAAMCKRHWHAVC